MNPSSTIQAEHVARQDSNDSLDPSDSSDLFADVLNLEEQYYTEGYNLGVSDGSRAGRIEGRVFGLSKGFDKFLEMGRLGGRATLWKSRLTTATAAATTTTTTATTTTTTATIEDKTLTRHPRQTASSRVSRNIHDNESHFVIRLGSNPRLAKHIERLDALTEPETIPTDNSEDGVAEFDDRLRDAGAKATLLGKLTGDDARHQAHIQHDRNCDTRRRVDGDDDDNDERGKQSAVQKRTGEMEDFVGTAKTRINPLPDRHD